MLKEHQQSQKSNFNVLAENVRFYPYIMFGTNIIIAINKIGNKSNLSENPDGKRRESKRARSEDPAGNRSRDPSDKEHSDSDSDGDVCFKGEKKSDRVDNDQNDTPQKKVKDSGNLLVNPDPVAKMMSQVSMTSTQSKNEGNEITTLLQQIFQEQDWGDPTDKELAETAKNLWHANIAKNKLKDHVENDKIPSNCTFL